MNDSSRGAPSRRHVLAVVGIGMIGAAAESSAAVPQALSAATPSPAPRLPASLKFGSLADWEAVLGHDFHVAGAGRVRLVAVEALGAEGRRPARFLRDRGFAAIFEAPAGALVGDTTYRLSHPRFPALDVHLGVAAQVKGKSRLVAVFN